MIIIHYFMNFVDGASLGDYHNLQEIFQGSASLFSEQITNKNFMLLAVYKRENQTTWLCHSPR